MQAASRHAAAAVLLAATSCVALGCRSGEKDAEPVGINAQSPEALEEPVEPIAARSTILVASLDDVQHTADVYDGMSGDPVWADMMLERMKAADVVILGEIHTDAAAHAMQQRLLPHLLEEGGALSMEMLETSDADVVAGGATMMTLAETSLAGWPSWQSFYAPAVETATAMGRPIVAANAPRPVVKLARLEGYEALKKDNTWYPGEFALPDEATMADLEDYRRRFGRAMSGHDDAAAVVSEADDQATTKPAPLPTDPMNEADLDTFFRAQLVWDATMAQQIFRAARNADAGPVVHFVGSFHSDFDGGLTTMLRNRGLDVVTVSFVPTSANRLQPGDEGRADYVIYTGPLDAPMEMSPLPPEAGDGPDGRKPPVLGEGPLTPAMMPVEPLTPTTPTTPTTRPKVFD